MKLRNFRKDKKGIILAGIVAITFIFLSSIIWLVGAYIVNVTYDELAATIAECDIRVNLVAQHALNAYAVSIVVIDILLLVWWGVSAQKREVVDEPIY